MPDLTIINNLEEEIHVAFFICAPTHWKNNLKPNERWTTHLPTMPLYFQVRWAQREDYENGTVYRSREFSPEESWETGATIGIACAAGTASVLTAVACTATGLESVGGVVAAPLMLAACAGGNRYATISSDSKLYETRVWVPWFDHKEYSVRNVDGARCVLWDVRENKQV
ncbi:hypothetical protein HYDPIDRAFT_118931 [Hydnomerulius pinastri MD-312]|uniref:Uncharacterized protein n=1 Tax=Hydnomerulius pinastri MD-312 TaxID=994086 RepID=A0A0C9W7S0_9AGAM|nr:hypothetical protein HYDPIDRAFT_118931 [Hydnomerulius pinastri MD-312]